MSINQIRTCIWFSIGIFFNGFFLWVQVVDHGVEIKSPSTHLDSVVVNLEDPALQPRSLANRGLLVFLLF